MKPKLKPPGTKHLELKCDILLSTSAFECNLRRYNLGRRDSRLPGGQQGKAVQVDRIKTRVKSAPDFSA